MPKPKQFLREHKKKAKQTQLPATADEYLAAGVDFEEAGEKWRAGDAAKSTRFFVRAINNYEEALSKFPSSFDLAYNRARVQFELTQYPKLAAQLPGTVLDLLRTARESSVIALRLEPDNTDALFNTAQVLASLAETILESPSAARLGNEDGLGLLEESVDLFQKCLTLQEQRYLDSRKQEEAVENIMRTQVSTTADESVEITDTDAEPTVEDQWATVIEPVTNDTLLDTVLAELEALTLLCSIVPTEEIRRLDTIEKLSASLLGDKLPVFISGVDRSDEAGLVVANFMSSLADAKFRSGRLDLASYQQTIQDAYGKLDLADDPEGLCDKAEALMAYNNALRLHSSAELQIGLDKETLLSRWNSLTTALECLTAAGKLASADNLEKIHLTRGDAEILRFQLSQPPFQYSPSIRNGPTLLKNASTFYRGAAALAKTSNAKKIFVEATLKEALALSLAGQTESLISIVKSDQSAAEAIIQDAVEDGLVSVDWLVSSGLTHL